MTKKQPAAPKIESQAVHATNLAVLQRQDSNIESILAAPGQCALYELDIGLKQWNRLDVEGSFFVVRRMSPPWHQIVIMNRRSSTNVQNAIEGKFECEFQYPFLLYRTNDEQVLGAWFYAEEMGEEVFSLLQMIIAYDNDQQKQQQESSTKSRNAASTSVSNITQMLQDAMLKSQTGSSNPPREEHEDSSIQSREATPVQSNNQTTLMTPSQLVSGKNSGSQFDSSDPQGIPFANPRRTKSAMHSAKSMPGLNLALSPPFRNRPLPAMHSENNEDDGPTAVLTREKLRKALLSLANDDVFIDALINRVNDA